MKLFTAVPAVILLIISAAYAEETMSNDFFSRIPKVTSEMQHPDFWVKLAPDPDQILATQAQLDRYNGDVLRKTAPCADIWNLKQILSETDLREMIKKVSSPPSKAKFINGKPIKPAYFKKLERNLNLGGIKGINKVRYGLTVRRSVMRTYPTYDRTFTDASDQEFDRFIETAVYPAEPLVILHQSHDGKWFFARAYNYLAWIPVIDVAVGLKDEVMNYAQKPHFLVVTGKKAFTNFNPELPQLSELQLEMGVRIPLAASAEIADDVYGQGTEGNHVVSLPVRTAAGGLEFKQGLIPVTEDVCLGYLPYTRRNILTQAFKFLGQRYGWGGQYNTRDCSAFIMDIFRSMGVLLPRNSGEQGKLCPGVKHDMVEGLSLDERKKIFDALPAGSALYMSGHAMLFLGKFGDDYFMIHDFAGFSVKSGDGRVTPHKALEVAVTPLLSIYLGDGQKSFMEGLYTAREFIEQ
ncbi:MAG: SH3 domain-containing protein [Candidatus Wallbacteria bacterium]|nr:SH3 domain-containing protein [Candidatus Wallbacteria bacterium]